MKVLLISDYGNVFGGAERQLELLRGGLRERGHDVRLFASTARPGGGASLADYTCLGTTSRFRTLLQSFNPWARFALARALDEFRPDVVHVVLFLTQLSPSILPVLHGTPSLLYAVWYRPVCPTGTKMWPDGSSCRVEWGRNCLRSGCVPARDWLPLMAQMTLWQRWRSTFDVIVANSEATRARLAEAGIAVPAVVWPGVPEQPMSRPLIPEPTIVFAGRLVREKGVDTLVRAFSGVARQVERARLVLAGDGPERPAIVELVKSLGIEDRVEMPGHLPFEESQRWFAGAWVQAVPSLWPEPFGMVAAEAMMRGTAVVASDTGGLREIVHEGRTGRLVTPGDAGALAEALLSLTRAPELADRMGRGGREIALTSFGVARHLDQFSDLYRDLVSRRGGASRR